MAQKFIKRAPLDDILEFDSENCNPYTKRKFDLDITNDEVNFYAMIESLAPSQDVSKQSNYILECHFVECATK